MNPRCNEIEDNNEIKYNMSCQMPVYECPMENVCERVIMHDVPHIVPIHTKIINRHVYKHSFIPKYTSSECDVCENVYDCGYKK